MIAALPFSLIGWLFALGLILLIIAIMGAIRDPLAYVISQIPAAGPALHDQYVAAWDRLIGHLEDVARGFESVWANYIRLPIERITATIGEIPHTLAVMKAIELQHYDELRGRATGDENAINSYVWALQGADVREASARYSADAGISVRQTGDENAINTYVHELQANIGEETLTRVQADRAIELRQTGDEIAINSYVHNLQGQVDRINIRQTGDENAINAYVHELRTDIADEATTRAGQIANLNNVLSTRLTRDETQEIADARNALSAVAAALAASEQYTHDAVSGAETQAQAEVAAAEAQAKAATQAAEAQATSALLRAQATTAQEIATAEAQAAAQVLGARQYAATIAAQAASAAQAGAIAQTLPIAQSVAGTLAHYLETCGDPMCAGLLDSAHLLTGLQALAGTGLLLALVEGLRHNPAGAADVVNHALAPLVSDVAQQVGRL